MSLRPNTTASNATTVRGATTPILMTDYADWLDHKCPECGHVLTTVEQLFNVIRVMTATARLNAALNKWLPDFVLRRLSRRMVEKRYDVDDKGRVVL